MDNWFQTYRTFSDCSLKTINVVFTNWGQVHSYGPFGLLRWIVGKFGQKPYGSCWTFQPPTTNHQLVCAKYKFLLLLGCPLNFHIVWSHLVKKKWPTDQNLHERNTIGRQQFLMATKPVLNLLSPRLGVTCNLFDTAQQIFQIF